MQRYFVPASYWHELEVVITGDNAQVKRFVEVKEASAQSHRNKTADS